jgi:hypothetical protein
VDGVVEHAFTRGINRRHLEALLLLPAYWRGTFMERVVLRLTLSVRETRRLAKLMLRVNDRFSLTLEEILERIEIDALLYESASAAGTKSAVEKRLTDMLDPSLDERRRAIGGIADSLERDGLLELDYDPFLEGKSVKAAFRFSSKEKVRLVLGRFSNALEKGEIEELFRHIRGESEE